MADDLEEFRREFHQASLQGRRNFREYMRTGRRQYSPPTCGPADGVGRYVTKNGKPINETKD